MENNKTVHSGYWSNIFKTPADVPDKEIFQNLPPFKNLDKKDFDLINNLIHDRNYVAGEFIFCEGDPGIGIYIIKEGEVEINITDVHKRVFTLATFSKGDFFGEIALIDGEKRSATAIAKTDAKLAVIFKPDLDEFIDKYPKKGIKVLQGITQIVAERLRKMDKDLVSSLSALPYQEKLFTEEKNNP